MKRTAIHNLSRIPCALTIAACLAFGLANSASAQVKNLPPDLANLPNEIKTLQWRSIDVGSAPILEQCRALLLMNHTLDELCNNATAEADLMSAYIEKNNLGAQFAKTPPPPSPPALSYPDAQKVAVALLRGPMSASYYATQLGDLDPSTLGSYQQMYARTCARRCSEFDESRHLVRCMSSFLGNADKLQDYDGWATAESARREAEYQKHAAAAPGEAKDAAAQQKMQAQVAQQQGEIDQMQAALASAHAQQSDASAQQPQQQQSGGQTMTPAGQPAQAVNGGYVVNGSTAPYGGYGAYGGYGGYGYAAAPAGAAAAGAYAGATAANNNNQEKNEAAAAGAAAANNQNHNATNAQAAAAGGAVAKNNENHNAANAQSAGAGQYHGANSSWNKSDSYHGQAQAQTNQRMSNFHGGGGGGGGRR